MNVKGGLIWYFDTILCKDSFGPVLFWMLYPLTFFWYVLFGNFPECFIWSVKICISISVTFSIIPKKFQNSSILLYCANLYPANNWQRQYRYFCKYKTNRLNWWLSRESDMIYQWFYLSGHSGCNFWSLRLLSVLSNVISVAIWLKIQACWLADLSF